MSEPTIICPKCGTEIKLTESLAAPLIASTRLQFEKQLAQKDSDIAQREQAMRDKEKALTDAKRDLDEQVRPSVMLPTEFKPFWQNTTALRPISILKSAKQRPNSNPI